MIVTEAYSLLTAQRIRADRAKIRELVDSVVAGGYSGPWAMDGKDRVY